MYVFCETEVFDSDPRKNAHWKEHDKKLRDFIRSKMFHFLDDFRGMLSIERCTIPKCSIKTFFLHLGKK